MLRKIFRAIRDARRMALGIISAVIVLYIAPYFLDAVGCIGDAIGCIGESTCSIRGCLGMVYSAARQDTNLAACVIALAVILAAWRPDAVRPE